MIYIFEGFDRSGKTTLSEMLAQAKNLKRFKSNFEIFSKVDLEEAVKHDWRFLLDVLSQVSIDLIFDRSFFSQYVYSMVLRRDNVLRHFSSMNEYEDLMKTYCEKLAKMPHLIVHCVRSDYSGVVDDKVDVALHTQINYNFEKIFSFCDKLHIVICTFEEGIQHNFEKVSLCAY